MLGLICSLLLNVNILNYAPPVNYQISLAGNFGEPRPNHFHGGIDVKTDGVEGKKVMTIADGFVSRVTIGLLGFGNAVYVQHPDGHTSVYCHLKSFSPRISALVKRWQYKHQCYIADVRLSPSDCPVAQGDFIAISGNTGASEAPHLHLEMHNTKTWEMVDPLDFLKPYVKDGMKPLAHGFMAYPKSGEGIFCNGTGKSSYGFPSPNLTRKFTAWGKVGFGIWANDYMEITYNRYGIRHTKLTVDGRVVFESDVSGIPVQDNLMVNSWGDYEHYCRYGVWYMKSFVEPGNRLPVLHADHNHGYIDFNQERDYHIVYTLTDFAGNARDYTFTVTGKRMGIPKKKVFNPRWMMHWNQTNSLSMPGMQLVIPYGMIADDVELQPSIVKQTGALSNKYKFYNVSNPMLGWGEVSICLNKKVKDTSKLYIESNNGVCHFMGGTFKNGWVTSKIRELGANYQIVEDITPPTVNPVGQGSWNTSHKITIGLTDSGSGLKSYKAYIDGQFVLFAMVPKSPWVECKLKDTPIAMTGKMHNFKFIAVDNRNNIRTFTTQVRY